MVKTSPLDELYSDLPVLVLPRWAALASPELLKDFHGKVSVSNSKINMKFRYDKLLFDYWKAKVLAHDAPRRAQVCRHFNFTSSSLFSSEWTD